MAVLGRLKIAPNQRLDLPDIIAFDSYSGGDWKGFLQSMVGDNPYIIKGFEIFQPNTLIGNPVGTVDIIISDSSLYWPASQEGSFFVSLPGASPVSVTLITDTVNYIEMSLTLLSGAQDARALWDPGANGGAGGEFTQVVDTENYLDVVVTRNNTGFSDDKIPIAKVVVTGSNVTSVTDCRPLMFRLGSGGTSPNPSNSFSWDDDPSGYSRTDTPVTMTTSLDANTFRGSDKNIKTLKDWMDAVMSRIREMSGGAKWFQNIGGGSGPGGLVSLSNLFLDSQAGHSPQPDRGVTVAWSKSNDGKFRSENAVGYTAPTRWKANFGQLKWSLGGTFISSLTRAYATYTFEKSVADGENLYLKLQRDAIINGDPVVSFVNINGVTASVSSTSSGSFSDIAVGDFIRKESGSTYQYYQVLEIKINSFTSFPNGTVDGTIADATVQYLVIGTHDGPIATSDEKYRFFRTQYQSSDLVASTYGYYDTSYYWLGRRFGSMFYFRDYGDIQPGEEVEVLNDSETQEHGGGGESGIILERSYDSVFSSVSGYGLKSGSGTLLTIHRRLLDNTVGTPSNSDNSGALLTYTIASPVGLMNDGDGLWVRLGNSSGALTSGTVTNVNTDNVWQVLDPSDTPLKSYDNRNVFLVARKFTIGIVECLIFSDGTMLSLDGQYVNNHLSVQGEVYANDDVYLRTKTQRSIPFIGTSLGRVDENNAEFFWNNIGGPSGDGQLGVRNLRISENSTDGYDDISQDTPQSAKLFSNLGGHTLKIGEAASTIHIPGNLVVDGYSIAAHATILQIDDKLLTLGVGNLSDGGYGAGIEIADDTKTATQIDSYAGQLYLDITFGASHGYTLGDIFAADSNTECGGITAGQMGRAYSIVTLASLPGEAQIMSTSVLRIVVDGSAASSTETLVLTPPSSSVRVYKSPSSIRMGNSDSSYTGMTSWVFRVKSTTTAPAITPVNGYGIVPTAHSSNMQSSRIAFVNNDNMGPSGADTTLNFSPNLTWDNVLNTLSISGTFSLTGNLIPSADDTYTLGTGLLQWHSLYIGSLPGSGIFAGGDTNLYRSAANQWKTDDNFEIAGIAGFDFIAQFGEQSAPPPAPSIGKVSVWADQTGLLYQRTSDGDVNLLTIVDGDVYEEVVDVVTSPSGNNEAAPMTPPAFVVIPMDTAHTVGELLIAAVTNGSSTVTVSRNSHGMSNGDLVTVTCSVTIGGISSVNLTVSNVPIFGVTTNSFQYTAGAVATSDDSGYIDVVTSIFQRNFLVGSKELEVYLNGQLLRNGVDYVEVGSPGSISSSIQCFFATVVGDQITYRIDSNGGQYIINQNGAATLQSAYMAGATINITVGNPVTITGSSGKLLHVAGDIQVDGVVDPLGMTFIPQATNPLPLDKSGIWANAAGELMAQKGDGVSSPVNVTDAVTSIVSVVDGTISIYSSEGHTIIKGTPIYCNASGNAKEVDVSVESEALAVIGLAQSDILIGTYGKVVSSGLVKDVSVAFSFGDVIYISKSGALTNIKPSVGVGGFLAGDFVVKVGVVTKNADDSLKKDIAVNVQIMGQL